MGEQKRMLSKQKMERNRLIVGTGLALRKVWRCQRGDQKPQIEEE